MDKKTRKWIKKPGAVSIPIVATPVPTAGIAAAMKFVETRKTHLEPRNPYPIYSTSSVQSKLTA